MKTNYLSEQQQEKEHIIIDCESLWIFRKDCNAYESPLKISEYYSEVFKRLVQKKKLVSGLCHYLMVNIEGIQDLRRDYDYFYDQHSHFMWIIIQIFSGR